MITIYHNSRCRKSRETLKIIEDSGHKPEIIEYLKNPPTADKLKDLITRSGRPLQDFIRRNEAIYREKFKGKNLSDEEWYKALAENPKLIERPIIERDNKVALGRPPEDVKTIL